MTQSATLNYGITTQDNACYKRSIGNSFEKILGLEGGWIEHDPHNANVIYVDVWKYNMRKTSDGRRRWNDLGIDTDNGNTESLSELILYQLID